MIVRYNGKVGTNFLKYVKTQNARHKYGSTRTGRAPGTGEYVYDGLMGRKILKYCLRYGM